MRFSNLFSRSSRDETEIERYSLIAEQDGRVSLDSELLNEIIDIEKREESLLVSVKSARSSVSSFSKGYLHHDVGFTLRDRVLSILVLLKSFIFLFLPTFITCPITHFTTEPNDHAKTIQLGPTAYLDGLRGVAAFIVYVFHFSYLWFPQLRSGYGVSDDNKLFWQLPIIRVLHSGRSSVTVFFVISGFVLTIKTLNMIHQRKYDQVLSALAGSSFRRPFRLYLPIIVSTFIIALVVYTGEYMRDPSGAGVPPRGNTFDEQLQHWFWSTIDLMNPFRHIINRENMKGSEYDGHLWTIPVEFKGSLLVFLLLLIFARARRWIHGMAVTGIAFWLVSAGDWDQALFAIGLLLAELSIVLPANPSTAEAFNDALPSSNIRIARKVGSSSLQAIRHVGTVVLFFFALHLLSYPEVNGASTPGFITLTQMVPAYYLSNQDRTQLFWNSVGSVIFIISLMYSPAISFNIPFLLKCRNLRLPWHHTNLGLEENEKDELVTDASADDGPKSEPLLQRLFTARLSQYLGHISYSLYLWHGAINHTVGVRWLAPASAVWGQTVNEVNALVAAGNGSAGDELLRKGYTAYHHAFFWGTLVNTLALLWASDVFNRLVDAPAVRFTRWIGEKAWRKE
ncbi:hypothetical protein ColLi_01181 [Colletotrichum liriopes]|uniref:Acyltransferase 3 domain-containing protein n=1 Tax=Colletotrichum liriopes TaxID=708192 RepID=A0AA37LN89_9PEZI|nr:hypothetical protein ColLi_01181 [Colletotrichum liriopes]